MRCRFPRTQCHPNVFTESLGKQNPSRNYHRHKQKRLKTYKLIRSTLNLTLPSLTFQNKNDKTLISNTNSRLGTSSQEDDNGLGIILMAFSNLMFFLRLKAKIFLYLFLVFKLEAIKSVIVPNQQITAIGSD